MAGFLKEFPMYSEWQYKWELSVERRNIMLADAPNVDYDKEEKDNDDGIVIQGTLDDVLGSAR